MWPGGAGRLACGRRVLGCLVKVSAMTLLRFSWGQPLLTTQAEGLAPSSVTSFGPSARLWWPHSEAPSDMFTCPFPLWG